MGNSPSAERDSDLSAERDSEKATLGLNQMCARSRI